MCGDHPRGCGEHTTGTSSSVEAVGSSPRMRGALGAVDGPVPGGRIIPADAGSTTYGHDHDCHDKDHPRGCGEHALGSRGNVNTQGSSPRMRGAPGDIDIPAVRHGIIPADAGSTVPL